MVRLPFIEEFTMNLEEVEGCFMELETASDTKPLLDKIFRLAHSLKGGSRSVGFADVAEFTHELESLVLALQKDKVSLTKQVVSTLLRANDRLAEMMAGLKSNIDARFDNSDVLKEIRSLLEGESTNPPASVSPKEAPEDISQGFMLFDDLPAIVPSDPIPPSVSQFSEEPLLPVVPAPVSESAEAQDEPKKKIAKKPDRDDEIVRVSLSKIELLNDFVGELIVLQAVIEQQAKDLSSTKLQTSIHQMVKLSKNVQELSSRS